MNRKFVIQSRVSKFEVQLLKQLAKQQEVSSSEYLRYLLRSAAQKSGLLPDSTSEKDDSTEPLAA